MRKLFFIFSFLLGFSFIINAQVVNIPDSNFKNCLLSNFNINTNFDQEIQLIEATAFNGTISCNMKNITSLVGIETFSALTGLECNQNSIQTIDLSQNIQLEFLDCNFNDLTNLLLFNNPNLTTIICALNKLTTLDLSNQSKLQAINCSYNKLTFLNCYLNDSLTSLDCSNNKLDSININNNLKLEYLNCS